MITEDQLEQLAIQWFQVTGWNYVHGAVIAPEAQPSPRPSPSGRGRNTSEREDFRAVVLRGRLAEAVRRFNPKLPESAVEEVRRCVAMPGRVLHGMTKPEHRICRPFRAGNRVASKTQGGALGCGVVLRWGGRMGPMWTTGARRRINP